MHRPRLFALALAGLLLFACAVPALAAEEPLPAVSSENATSIGEGALTEPTPTPELPEESTPPEPESVASEDELLNWLNAHKATGGTLTLTQDITITQFAEFSITASVTIDCGGFRLFVAHNFSLMGNIVLKGTGHHEGLVRILPNGMLSLDYGATVQTEGGVAVWQDEGAAFYNGANLAADTVHYANTPIIIWFDSGNDDLIAVPKDGAYTELLPKEKKATVNQNGKNILNTPLPLVWDTSSAAESLTAKKRTTLTGSFAPHAMLFTVVPPSCTVVFREREVSFQRFSIRGTDAYALMSLSCFLPPRSLDLTLSYSFDGETWTPLLQQTHDGTEEIGVFQPVLIRENGYTEALAEGEILWPPDSQEKILRFVISYEENGETHYSDVICFDGDTFTPGEDYDGNRGGGGELDGGDSLPTTTPEPPPGNGGYIPEDGTGDNGSGASDGSADITPPLVEDGTVDEPLIVPEPTPQPVEPPSQPPESILPTLPPADTPPPVEFPVSPVEPALPQIKEVVKMSPGEEIPQAVATEPDAAPLAKPLQIVLGGLLTLGILAAFVFYGKKR